MSLKRVHFLVLGIVLMLTLMLLNLPVAASTRLKLGFGGIFLPLFGLGAAAQSFVDRVAWSAVPRRSLVSEIERLQKDNAQLQFEVAQGDVARQERDRLAQDLAWVRKAAWKLKPARVIGREPTTWWRTVQVDFGARDGARVNQPVLTPNGIVGRINAVGYDRSQVALVGDADCGLAVIVAETRDNGIIKGPQASAEYGLMEMSLLQNSPQLMAGQAVVTSGLGGVFPKGIPVGRIVDTRPMEAGLFTTARIQLGANLNRLEEVWILL